MVELHPSGKMHLNTSIFGFCVGFPGCRFLVFSFVLLLFVCCVSWRKDENKVLFVSFWLGCITR